MAIRPRTCFKTTSEEVLLAASLTQLLQVMTFEKYFAGAGSGIIFEEEYYWQVWELWSTPQINKRSPLPWNKLKYWMQRRCVLRRIEKNWNLACLVIFAVVMGTNQIYFIPNKFTILYTKVNMGMLTDKTTYLQSI